MWLLMLQPNVKLGVEVGEGSSRDHIAYIQSPNRAVLSPEMELVIFLKDLLVSYDTEAS